MSLSTSFTHWVPEVTELDMAASAVCKTAFPIWSPGVWLQPQVPDRDVSEQGEKGKSCSPTFVPQK